jgi:ABC-2 type transport system ATP-binding protein
MLNVQGLNKSYAGRAVVRDLSFSIGAGQIVGLLGPNGAGKSTTVAMICGLTAPDTGQVLIGAAVDRNGAASGDLAASSGAQRDALKCRIGLVPQDLALYEDLSARHNLELFGALYGLERTLLRERVEAALALVGLADRAGDRAAQFSGGMKRRLNIACALVHDPDILVLDEPTVGVDPQSRNAIFDNLETLRSRGKALLYTTHYMEEAERLCDRIVIMDHGLVVASDDLSGLLRRLPAAESLQIELGSEVDLAAMSTALGLPYASQQAGVLTAGLGTLDTDAPRLLGWLVSQGHTLRRISSGRANLEDVFLALTGRQLRD